MTTSPETLTALVRFINELADLRRHIKALEYAAIDLARSAGATWQEIGDELDISRQAARSRFGQPRDRRS